MLPLGGGLGDSEWHRARAVRDRSPVSAAAVVSLGIEASDYTQKLPAFRATACATVLLAALVAMAAQGENPFLYFIF